MYANTKAILSEGWSNEEKVVLTTGVGWANGLCVGNIAGVEERGFPGLCLEVRMLSLCFGS